MNRDLVFVSDPARCARCVIACQPSLRAQGLVAVSSDSGAVAPSISAPPRRGAARWPSRSVRPGVLVAFEAGGAESPGRWPRHSASHLTPGGWSKPSVATASAPQYFTVPASPDRRPIPGRARARRCRSRRYSLRRVHGLLSDGSSTSQWLDRVALVNSDVEGQRTCGCTKARAPRSSLLSAIFWRPGTRRGRPCGDSRIFALLGVRYALIGVLLYHGVRAGVMGFYASGAASVPSRRYPHLLGPAFGGRNGRRAAMGG